MPYRVREEFVGVCRPKRRPRSSAMECGGKRSATPLSLVLPPNFRLGHHPKRRRASLAAALHISSPTEFSLARRIVSQTMSLVKNGWMGGLWFSLLFALALFSA